MFRAVLLLLLLLRVVECLVPSAWAVNNAWAVNSSWVVDSTGDSAGQGSEPPVSGW